MKLFLECHAARDEYLGQVIGFFVFRFCLVGLFVWSKDGDLMIGIVLFNVCFGVWIGPGVKEN